MTESTDRSADAVAGCILRSGTSQDPADGHLDENDLVLLEMNLLNNHERAAIREHISACGACRQQVSQVLRRSCADAQLSAINESRSYSDSVQVANRSSVKSDRLAPDATYIHPSAIVDDATIGRGTNIWAFAHVLRGAIVGDNCNICDHSYVEGGARVGDNVTLKNHVCVWEGITIEDDVFVGPYVAFTNDLYPRSARGPTPHQNHLPQKDWLVETVLKTGCSIGANATILAGVRIGSYSLVAAGAVVTQDVEPFALMMGVPARRVGYVCRCGKRLDQPVDSATCVHCGRHHELHEGQLSAI